MSPPVTGRMHALSDSPISGQCPFGSRQKRPGAFGPGPCKNLRRLWDIMRLVRKRAQAARRQHAHGADGIAAPSRTARDVVLGIQLDVRFEVIAGRDGVLSLPFFKRPGLLCTIDLAEILDATG